jgi:hypothetical protein
MKLIGRHTNHKLNLVTEFFETNKQVIGIVEVNGKRAGAVVAKTHAQALGLVKSSTFVPKLVVINGGK